MVSTPKVARFRVGKLGEKSIKFNICELHLEVVKSRKKSFLFRFTLLFFPQCTSNNLKCWLCVIHEMLRFYGRFNSRRVARPREQVTQTSPGRKCSSLATVPYRVCNPAGGTLLARCINHPHNALRRVCVFPQFSSCHQVAFAVVACCCRISFNVPLSCETKFNAETLQNLFCSLFFRKRKQQIP